MVITEVLHQSYHLPLVGRASIYGTDICLCWACAELNLCMHLSKSHIYISSSTPVSQVIRYSASLSYNNVRVLVSLHVRQDTNSTAYIYCLVWVAIMAHTIAILLQFYMWRNIFHFCSRLQNFTWEMICTLRYVSNPGIAQYNTYQQKLTNAYIYTSMHVPYKNSASVYSMYWYLQCYTCVCNSLGLVLYLWRTSVYWYNTSILLQFVTVES